MSRYPLGNQDSGPSLWPEKVFPRLQGLVMLPYPLEDILQDAVEQVIVLLCNLKTGRTMEGMMVIAVIRDAVLCPKFSQWTSEAAILS